MGWCQPPLLIRELSLRLMLARCGKHVPYRPCRYADWQIPAFGWQQLQQNLIHFARYTPPHLWQTRLPGLPQSSVTTGRAAASGSSSPLPSSIPSRSAIQLNSLIVCQGIRSAGETPRLRAVQLGRQFMIDHTLGRAARHFLAALARLQQACAGQAACPTAVSVKRVRLS